jgi:predicted nuclease with TOPRIM domain
MEKICEMEHRRIDEKLDLAETRLNAHSERIDSLERNQARLDESIKGLVTQLAGLNSTLRWFIGLLAGSFVSFFFAMVQKGLM